MINPTMLMPKKPKGEGMREIARMIMSGQPIKSPNKRIVDAFTPTEQRRYDGLGLGNKMLVDDEMQRGAPMWQTLDGAPPLPQDPAVPPLGDGGSPIENEDPRGMFYDIDSRFLDDQAYQVADASGGIDPMRGMAEPPAVGGDAVATRSLVNDEVVFRDALNGLSGIMEELQNNPDLLDSAHTLTGRGRTAWLKFRDRLGIDGFDIGPEQEAELADTTAYKQELLTRVNQYIKDITGAQVGQGDETRRLMAVQANESDSPTQVVAKISNALDLARLDIVRRKLMQRTDGPAPTDKEVREFLRNRGKELYDLAVNEGLSPTDARMRAAEMLSEEYGF